MKKKLLTTLVAAIMTVTCVTAANATSCPRSSCNGTLLAIGCDFSSLSACETSDPEPCDDPEHSNCSIITYYADSVSECNRCDRTFYGAETHPHAVGHVENGEDYNYAMNTVCYWF